MRTISIEVEDSFYNDLLGCANANGFPTVELCMEHTAAGNVETYRKQNVDINTTDFPSLTIPDDPRGEE